MHEPWGRVLLAFLIAWGTDFSSANENVDSTAITTAQVATDILTLEQIKAKLKEVHDNARLDEVTKQSVIDLYKQTSNQLTTAQEFATRAIAYETLRREAPKKVAAIEEQLKTIGGIPLEPERPLIPTDIRAEELEQELTDRTEELSQVHVELNRAQITLEELNDEIGKQPEHPLTLRNETYRQLQELLERTESPEVEQPVLVTEADKYLRRATEHALRTKIEAYDQEYISYNARVNLRMAQRDLLVYEVGRLQAQSNVLQEAVDILKQKYAMESTRAAREDTDAAQTKHPVVQALTKRNLALTQTTEQLISLATEKKKDVDRKVKLLKQLKDTYAKSEQKLAAVPAEAIAVLLRREREWISPYLRGSESHKNEKRNVILEHIEIQNDRDRLLSNLEQAVEHELLAITGQHSQKDLDHIQSEVAEQLTKRLELLQNLNKSYEDYYSQLEALDLYQNQLTGEANEYAKFIDRNMLWIRSGPPLNQSFIDRVSNSWRRIFQTGLWFAFIKDIWNVVQTSRSSVVLIVFVILLLGRPLMFIKLRIIAKQVWDDDCDRIGLTIRALLITVLLASTWPLIPGALAWLFLSSESLPTFTVAVAGGLKTAATWLFMAELLRMAFHKHGLAMVHFRWSHSAVRMLRHYVRWLMIIALPAAFVVSVTIAYDMTLDQQPGDEGTFRSSLGRLAFFVGVIAVLVVTHKIFGPRRGLLSATYNADPRGWAGRLRYVSYLCGVSVLTFILFLLAFGYDYTASQLGGRLGQALWLLISGAILYYLFLRWIFLCQRKVALSGQSTEGGAKNAPSSVPSDGDPWPPKLNLDRLEEKPRKLVGSLLGLAVILGLWLVWSEVLPLLGVLDEIKLPWDKNSLIAGVATSVPITLLDLALCILIVTIAILAASHVTRLFDIIILERLPIQGGSRYAITTMGRYLIIIIGAIMAFTSLGFEWSEVQWIVAAISLGLGFGLQEIFANFVSGLILLVERPIRVGDTITVADEQIVGIVTRIRTRATTVIDRDRREIVIPNRTFISNKFVNWSLSDSLTRLKIPVHVGYGSDTDRIHEILMDLATSSPRVLKDPRPKVLFKNFGDSSLDFEVRVYVRDYSARNKVRNELLHAIIKRFRKEDIEMPYPQRDIHVRKEQEHRQTVADSADRIAQPMAKADVVGGDRRPEDSNF